jgi:hypothetical protein
MNEARGQTKKENRERHREKTVSIKGRRRQAEGKNTCRGKPP